MVKKVFLVLLLNVCLVSQIVAQGNAFVLIDVSGNPRNLAQEKKVTNSIHKEAEDLVKDLIQGRYNAARFDKNWRLSGNTDPLIKNIVEGKGQPLTGNSGHLLLMPFGAKNTYRDFKINRIKRFPGDFNNYWQTPTRYDDQNTFGEIAKAKAADIAIDANLSDYYLIVISGLGEDTGSRTDLYDSEEIEYLDNYKSAVIQNSLAIFRYRDSNKDFKVEISYMDLKKMRAGAANTAGTTQIITSKNVDTKSLEIVTPKGTRKAPFKLESERLLVSWACLGCSDSTEYVVRVTGIDDKKNTQVKKVSGRFNQSFTLEGDGAYQVSVSGGSGLSDRQFLNLSTGGGGGFGIVLILLAIGGGGYLAYRQFFSGKGGGSSSGPVESDDNFFSDQGSNTGSSGASGSSNNNGYF